MSKISEQEDLARPATFYGRVWDRLEQLVDEGVAQGKDFPTVKGDILEILSWWMETGDTEDPGFVSIQEDFPTEVDFAQNFVPELYALEGMAEKGIEHFFGVGVTHLEI